MLFLQLLVQLFGEQTQIFAGIQQLDLVIDDVDVGPLGSFTFHDQSVPAGVLQLGTPDTTGVRAGDHAGQRRLGDDHVTAGGGSAGAGQRTGDVNQLVVGTQGVSSGAALVVDDLGTQTTATNELLSQIGIQLFNSDGAGGQVNAGKFFVVCVCHNDNLQKFCIYPIFITFHCFGYFHYIWK